MIDAKEMTDEELHRRLIEDCMALMRSVVPHFQSSSYVTGAIVLSVLSKCNALNEPINVAPGGKELFEGVVEKISKLIFDQTIKVKLAN